MGETMDPLESVEGAADPLAAKPAAAVNSTALRWIGYALALAGFLLGLADLAHPSLLLAEILLVAPAVILALVLSSPASFEVAYRGSQVQINVVLGLPILMLFMVNLFHAQIDPLQPLIPAAVGAVIGLAAGAYAVTTPGVAGPMTMIGFFAACGGAYAWGGVATARHPVRYLARRPPPGADPRAAPVLRPPRQYHVELAPWGPQGRAERAGSLGQGVSAASGGRDGLRHPPPGSLSHALVRQSTAADRSRPSRRGTPAPGSGSMLTVRRIAICGSLSCGSPATSTARSRSS